MMMIKRKVASSLQRGFVFLALAVVGITMACAQVTTGPDPVVGKINSEPVSAAEYRLVMERQVPGVYACFKQKENLDDHLGYWSESSGPQGPLAKLREVVRNELIRIKVCQGLAKEKGLIQDTTYVRFQKELEQENARRNQAALSGQVIYGPRKYSGAVYYYIRLGEVIYQVNQALARSAAPRLTEAEIAAFYQENKALLGDTSLADARPRMVIALSEKAAEKELKSFMTSARVEIDETQIRGIVPRSDALL